MENSRSDKSCDSGGLIDLSAVDSDGKPQDNSLGKRAGDVFFTVQRLFFSSRIEQTRLVWSRLVFFMHKHTHNKVILSTGTWFIENEEFDCDIPEEYLNSR